MNLPHLIKQLYGVFTFTGLYSFEFVDRNRNPITEIFFMIPPKTKSVTEGTRSTTIPTLNGNYNNDAGNSTKTISLTGDLFFPYVGSPTNPIAPNNENLENTIDGMTEFFKLRWMLIRYRDYTMSRTGKLTVPITAMQLSPELKELYKAISKRLSIKVGALYDEVRVIFHDYDMDDHFYCRVESFTSNQTDTKYLAASYSIELECYEPDSMQKFTTVKQVKQKVNDSVNITNTQIQNVGFALNFEMIQAETSYDTDFYSNCVSIQSTIDLVNTENDAIQAGKTTATANLPVYVDQLMTKIDVLLSVFITTFLTSTEQTAYTAGTVTLDDCVDINLFTFYNVLQKLKFYAESLNGIINSIVQTNDIRFYTNANDYTLTEEQFDDEDATRIENESSFYFYTIQEGDTLRSIALRELKDSEKYTNILQVNDITENDLIDGLLIGEKIRIPIEYNLNIRSDDNLVYESVTDDNEKFLHGSDIATDINDRLLISSKGDLKSQVGIQNTFDNIQNRIENRKGSLNVLNPSWGTIAIDEDSAPLLVKIDRYITDVVNQIQTDPRVESVQIDFSKMIISGEVIKIYAKVFFIGNDISREVVA